jgi:protein-S-isoprenylcysteine O-methyltransferase Ste14
MRFLGMGAVLFGSGLLFWCVQDFLVEGRGTLAPWAPPQSLVQVGLYRFSRNPMYLAVEVVLLGWAAWFQSPGLILYAVSALVAFHLRIVFGEEPWLARQYGKDWASYRASVPRWLRWHVD